MKYFFAITLIFLSLGSSAFAQENLIQKYFGTGGEAPKTLEEALELKRQLLEALGLPADTPTTVEELLNENLRGKSLFPQLKNDLSLSFSTETFSPGARVRAQIVGFATDPRTSQVTWVHNGRSALSGPGQTSYEFTLGAVGTSETIVVTVNDGTQSPPVARKTIYPARVHLGWFSDSYTPPWYRGKALFTPRSEVTIVAKPELALFNSRFPEDALTYTWSVNGQKIGNNTGRGKNTYTFTTSSVRGTDYEIAVEVKDAQERIITKEIISIEGRQPELILYERLSLHGIKSWLTLSSSEVPGGGSASIEVEPFFIPKKDLSSIQYTWKINGQTVGEKFTKLKKLLFRSEAGNSGSQSIEVSYQNPNNIFQRGNVDANLKIK